MADKRTESRYGLRQSEEASIEKQERTPREQDSRKAEVRPPDAWVHRRLRGHGALLSPVGTR